MNASSQPGPLDLDEERRRALVGGDIDRLRTLVAPDCLWAHASGLVESGEAYLAGLAGGRFAYESLQADEVVTVRAGTAVVVNYRQSASMVIDGAHHRSASRCSAVWAPSDGRLQLVAFQSTPIRS